jgi:UDP-N-acetylglucosamine--N-acetylmuramyl-(pentapeptide) pyrophosphoryl-undecaprenol N-acetylglucosamine transferase
VVSDPLFILAGGATGGHLCPGIAVADALVRLEPGAQVVFACADRPTDHAFLDPLDYGMVVQPVRPMPRSIRGWWQFLRSWRASRRLARAMVDDLQPAAVLGLGGYAAGPVVREAAAANVPAALLNPDAVPGRANRYLARRVEAIFTQYPRAASAFPADQAGKIHCVGCPVRRFPSVVRDEAIEALGLRADRKTLLVLGGSLGALSINRAVGALAEDLAALADRWQLLHLTGGKLEFSPERFAPTHAVAMEFCRSMHLAYTAADAVLSRGGASTLAELVDRGLPAAVMPYPHHRDQQQKRNGLALVEAGAAVLIEDRLDPAENADALRRDLLPILRDPGSLASMRRAAEQMGARRADREVAAWMLRAAGKEIPPAAAIEQTEPPGPDRGRI